jgi:hypothetical protein
VAVFDASSRLVLQLGSNAALFILIYSCTPVIHSAGARYGALPPGDVAVILPTASKVSRPLPSSPGPFFLLFLRKLAADLLDSLLLSCLAADLLDSLLRLTRFVVADLLFTCAD